MQDQTFSQAATEDSAKVTVILLFVLLIGAAVAAVVSVNVTIVKTPAQSDYNSVTDKTAQYPVPNLPVGTYELKFQRPGFKSRAIDFALGGWTPQFIGNYSSIRADC